MEISDKLKEFMGIATGKVAAYGEQVKERVTNPLQTLATALEEGMPTEDNPLGMTGVGSVSKFGSTIRDQVAKEIAEGKIAKPTKQTWGKFTTKDGDTFVQQSDGTWDSGKETFDSLQDFLRARGIIK